MIMAIYRHLSVNLYSDQLFNRLILRRIRHFVRQAFRRPAGRPRYRRVLAARHELIVRTRFDRTIFRRYQSEDHRSLRTTGPWFLRQVIYHRLHLIRIALLRQVHVSRGSHVKFRIFRVRFRHDKVRYSRRIHLVTKDGGFAKSRVGLRA